MLQRNVTVAVLLVWLFLLPCIASSVKKPFSGIGEDCQQTFNNQCNIAHDIRPVESSNIMPTYKLSWDGIPASDAEMLGVSNLRVKADHESRNTPQAWLFGISDVELLRFLRARNGHEKEAWDMILSHVDWRGSEFGADANFTRTFFINSPLHHEVFWMGVNKENCPTLVIRSQIHDGIYYNEDPRVFTR